MSKVSQKAKLQRPSGPSSFIFVTSKEMSAKYKQKNWGGQMGTRQDTNTIKQFTEVEINPSNHGLKDTSFVGEQLNT